jgi:hypothetical protein
MKREIEGPRVDPELVYQLCELAKIEEDPAKRIAIMERIIEIQNVSCDGGGVDSQSAETCQSA